jgi:hypothetical protein
MSDLACSSYWLKRRVAMKQKRFSNYFSLQKILIRIYLTITLLFIYIGGCGHSQSSGSYRVKPSFKGIRSSARVSVIILLSKENHID